MPLTSGTTLGPYSATAKIDEGGMGEVWQARDTKLDRDVALKVLPEAFTSDPDRLARFEREAKVLASLNHPNIGSIYGLEEAEGVKALVLELVEGPTLADRITQGPIPIDEALPIARQITEALEAAHEQGVIHRDLDEEGHLWPFVIPEANAVLLVITNTTGYPLQSGELAVAALDTGEITRLGLTGTSPRYVATGHLVFAVGDGSLRAVPFDATRFEVTGNPVPVVEGVQILHLKQRFEREAKTISSLNHPHICTLHDIGEQDGIDSSRHRTLS